jgi:hypothetical protein
MLDGMGRYALPNEIVLVSNRTRLSSELTRDTVLGQRAELALQNSAEIKCILQKQVMRWKIGKN